MTVENTRNRDPLLHLAGLMSDGASGYIQGMEAEGQKQVVNSDLIPTTAPWDDLAALGFIKGEPVSGDDLFTHATLPEGWGRAGTGHSMHSDIVDERGIPRVGIFYKAAYYDRRADAYIKSVANDLVTDLLYGDGPAALPAKWDVLTDEEKADYFRILRLELESTRESVRSYPWLDSDGNYTNRVKRAEKVLALKK